MAFWALCAVAVVGAGVLAWTVAGARPDADAALVAAAEEGPGGHEGEEGLVLRPAAQETVSSGRSCADARVRSYDIAAIAVDITLNRFGDHDPEGRMFALSSEVPRIRAEEARNRAAAYPSADAGDEPAVSIGLQGDAIQPLTLRVLPGECLRVTLNNQLDEPASFHVHGSALRVAATGAAATAGNPDATAAPDRIVTYEWYVPDDEPEGTHYAHSHGDTREQTSHGLFGAVIVEPPGSRWTDPRTGEVATGWDAVVQDPGGPDFREFALYYHEIGHENYKLTAAGGDFVPQVDPVTSAYRPSARALNYRSEPFMHRLALQAEGGALGGLFDEGVAYSSYTFGDPATPVLRAYVGEPTKQRVIHAGSEVFHVHHVHGGASRWSSDPEAEGGEIATGLDKHPPLRPSASERLDSQGIGPAETFDVVNECGAGGCQQSVGDFMYHCHVGEHYIAGMWGIWRVYNTAQDGVLSTDTMPRLRPLDDLADAVPTAVTSEGLVGRTYDRAGTEVTLDGGSLAAWVEPQLPPAGRPNGYDASVLDWERRGDLYAGEPDDTRVWPGYRSSTPGERPPLLFDPGTGRLAFPFLRPHLGARPPFAPNHGPAPYLDPFTDGPDPPAPGANGPASVCPEGTRLRQFEVHAVSTAVPVNRRLGIVDSQGMLFALKEDLPKLEADPLRREPLAIRANAGEDCVDIVLASQLPDDGRSHGYSKVNAHVHFVQFDVLASDGVPTGFGYEQSVRPYGIEGTTVADAAAAGASRLVVGDAARFQPGVVVGIGLDPGATFEARKVLSVEGDVLVLDAPLRAGHAEGEAVSVEFVRYRWYPDVQFGTAYFHDHVNAIGTWRHGLYGALVGEPPGSTYHDPATGEAIRSGARADVHTDEAVSVDVAGSFRELVTFLSDDNPVNHVGRSSGGALNLRAEPLERRSGPPDRRLSSEPHGDPATPVVDAVVGDPVVFRTLVGGTNDTHTFHVDGHWFRAEPWNPRSRPVSTVALGISERRDVVVPAAGGPARLPGDYVFGNGRLSKQDEGVWGLLRVHPPGDTPPGVRPLPDRVAPTAGSSPCPAGAPVREIDLAAVTAPLPMLGGAEGLVYVTAADLARLRDGSIEPEPLVLHVGVGDCLRVRLTNETTTPVALHCDPLTYRPDEMAGGAAGRNRPAAVAAGSAGEATFFASPEVGEVAALCRDVGDPVANVRRGLYGAVVVGPAGATYRDPYTGADASTTSAWHVVVDPPDGPPYRDVTLLWQDEDDTIGTHRMPYTRSVAGTVGINYRSAPLEGRADGGDPSTVYRSTGAGDPGTPLIEAFAGDPLRVHVLAPASEQAQVFSVEGHRWRQHPGADRSAVRSAAQIGGLQVVTVDLEGGAGGVERLGGDYLYGDHREPYREAGMWGILRVHDGSRGTDLRTLAGQPPWLDDDYWRPGALLLAGVALAGGLRFRRGRGRARRALSPPA